MGRGRAPSAKLCQLISDWDRAGVDPGARVPGYCCTFLMKLRRYEHVCLGRVDQGPLTNLCCFHYTTLPDNTYTHTHIHNSATHSYDPASFHGADHPGATIRWRRGRECASDRLGHRHQHRPCHRIVACRATDDGCNRWSWLWPESTLACPAHAEYEDHIDTDTDASIATHVCCVAQPATPLTPPTTTFAPRLE